MKIASLLFIPALLLSGLTARAGLPASFKERLAEASRENRTIQCDFTQRKQVRRMNTPGGEFQSYYRFAKNDV